MHRDTKLGLALGVLLLGIVGAFFFRNEPLPVPEAPKLRTAEALDAQIAEKAVTPYITGVEPVEGPKANTVEPAPSPSMTWELPDFLAENGTGSGTTTAAKTGSAPDPIHAPGGTPPSPPIPIPPHNQAWTPEPGTKLTPTRPTAAESPRTTGNRLRYHLVQKGDTLTELAMRYLGSTTRFAEIYEANRDQLRSPDDVRIGMKLTIPSAAAKADEASPAGTTVSDAGVVKPVSTAASKTNTPPAEAVPSAEKTAKKPRFKPVSRIPFAPRAVAPRSKDSGETKPTPRSLSQRPPTDGRAVTDDTLAVDPVAAP